MTNYISVTASLRQTKGGSIASEQGGVAACLYSLGLGTSKKINCGLLRFARNDRLQMRHCELPLPEWQEIMNCNIGARQPAFIFLSWVQAKRKTADCFASLAMTGYRCVTASPRQMKSGNNLNPNKGARQSAFVLLSWVQAKR